MDVKPNIKLDLTEVYRDVFQAFCKQIRGYARPVLKSKWDEFLTLISNVRFHTILLITSQYLNKDFKMVSSIEMR